MLLTDTVKSELQWWKVNLKDNVHYIKDKNFEMTIFTDASLTVWGAVEGKRKNFGHWSAEEKSFHINCLELLTVKIALYELAADVYNEQY